MCDHTRSARTHSDQAEADPRTVARVVRHATTGLAAALAVLSLISLGLGLAHDTLEAFIVGCTVLACGAYLGAVSLGVYMVELLMRGQHAIREEARALGEGHEEFRRRFADLEAGERAIAGAVRTISDPPDELGQRRGGGRQS